MNTVYTVFWIGMTLIYFGLWQGLNASMFLFSAFMASSYLFGNEDKETLTKTEDKLTQESNKEII